MLPAMNRLVPAVFATLVSSLCLPVAASTPSILPTQGVLRDNAGVVLYEGLYSVAFSLYDRPDSAVPV